MKTESLSLSLAFTTQTQVEALACIIKKKKACISMNVLLQQGNINYFQNNKH